MGRHALTDQQWVRLRQLLPSRRGPKSNLGDRLFIDAVLYRAKTGLPWRDLPERFGPWKTVYDRFCSWARAGLWEQIFRKLQLEVDDTGSIIDASVVRAHQEAAGGKATPVLGRSVLSSAQALSCDRDALREDRAQLPGAAASGLQLAVAQRAAGSALSSGPTTEVRLAGSGLCAGA